MGWKSYQSHARKFCHRKSQSLYLGAWLKKHGGFASENAKAFEKMKRGEQFGEIMVGV